MLANAAAVSTSLPTPRTADDEGDARVRRQAEVATRAGSLRQHPEALVDEGPDAHDGSTQVAAALGLDSGGLGDREVDVDVGVDPHRMDGEVGEEGDEVAVRDARVTPPAELAEQLRGEGMGRDDDVRVDRLEPFANLRAEGSSEHCARDLGQCRDV